jgi:hypothetical protein
LLGVPASVRNGVILDDWVDGIWADLGLGGATLTVGTAKLAEFTDEDTAIGNQPDIGGSGLEPATMRICTS